MVSGSKRPRKFQPSESDNCSAALEFYLPMYTVGTMRARAHTEEIGTA